MKPLHNPVCWFKALASIHMTHLRMMSNNQKLWLSLWGVKA